MQKLKIVESFPLCEIFSNFSFCLLFVRTSSSYLDPQQNAAVDHALRIRPSFSVMQLVATASTDGVVRVLELERGRLVAQQRLPGHVFSSPVVVARTPRRESSTAAVSHACSVLVGCRDNNLYRLDLVEVSTAQCLEISPPGIVFRSCRTVKDAQYV